MTLGDIIKTYRNENHASMEYVANLCGITKGYVSMLEKNINSKTGRPVKPTIETIVKICNGLHLDLNTVFDLLDDDYEITVAPAGIAGDEQVLLGFYRELNDEGKEKLVDYADDLCSSGKYKKHCADRMVEA